MFLLFSFSIITVISTVYDHLLLTRKKTLKYAAIIFTIYYIISIFSYIFVNAFFKDTIIYKYLSIILGLGFIIYIYLIFEESLAKKIFTMFSVWVFSSLILILSAHIIKLFLVTDLNLYILFTTVVRVLIELILLPVTYFYFQNRYKKMLKLVSNKVINLVSIYSFLIFLFLVNYYLDDLYKPLNPYIFFNSMLFIVIIILSYIVIFIAIWSVNLNIELKYKFEFTHTQIELHKQNYKTLNKALENYYAFKHDLRHHFSTIKLMIDGENYKAASDYLVKFNEKEINQNIGVLCENFTVDSILKYYINIGRNTNISFKVDLNIPEEINIDKLDLSIVIGNCVENAIEACNKMVNKGERYINIKANIKGSNLVIVFKNSFEGEVIKEGDIIKTSKKNEVHGIGLSNVKEVAEKYKGYFNVQLNVNEFKVYIMLNFN